MKTFHLTVMRRDKIVFEDDVAALCCSVGADGAREEILPGHEPMLFSITLGMADIRLQSGEKKRFATGDGIVMIERGRVQVLSDFIAWEDRLDRAIEHRQSYIDKDLSRRRQSYHEYRMSKINLTKTFIHLSGRQDHEPR